MIFIVLAIAIIGTFTMMGWEAYLDHKLQMKQLEKDKK